MKRQLRCHDALANCYAIFVRMKRSAQLIFHVPKARFIGRSPASFFMHRRCASLSFCLNQATMLRYAPRRDKSRPLNACARMILHLVDLNSAMLRKPLALLSHELRCNSTLFLALLGTVCHYASKSNKRSQRKNHVFRRGFPLAPPAGLEPATP